MKNRAALLKQSDLTRYAKAMRAADVVEYRVVVRTDGTHEIIVGKASVATGSATGWEDV
jgi:hypothetical protein